MRDHLNASHANYHNLISFANDSFDFFVAEINETTGMPEHPVIVFDFLPDFQFGAPRKAYPLTNISLGPFTDMSPADLKSFMRMVESFEVYFTLVMAIP